MSHRGSHRSSRNRIPTQNSKIKMSYECQHDGHLLCADSACQCWHHGDEKIGPLEHTGKKAS